MALDKNDPRTGECVHPYVQSKLPWEAAKAREGAFRGTHASCWFSVASRDGTSCIDIQQIATFHKLMCLYAVLGFRSFVK